MVLWFPNEYLLYLLILPGQFFIRNEGLKSPYLQTLGTHKNTLTLREQPGEQF